ncbi:hypothetical protein BB561_001890 [Smittium simulii]|uniref:Uncharacterized protein n=1 Tax=Smittium simulii TaxID=133385 RepID=A0A2T9YSL9_9FUNG|nr:hypothetical protein BB561_001890 [Smittium simulii]
MNEATLQRIEELTEKVNQLLLARETVPAPVTVPEPKDEFITTRAPASELKIYPMLKDALPSIEQDFFRIQLTEEKQKDAIYSCPRSSFMNYLPPPLNDSALTVVRKADSTLHGIQVALAQATRPVDYYVHRIIQDNPGITSDDPRFLFADTMRVLRLTLPPPDPNGPLCRGPPRNVQTDMEEAHGQQMGPEHCREGFQDPVQGSETSPHVFEAEPNKRFDGEDVDVQRAAALWATAINDAPTSVQAETQSRGPPDPDGGSGIIADKESNRGSQDTRSRLLQPTVRHPKEDRGTQTCSRLTETELSCRREELQDSAPVWTVSQPTHFYQDAPPDTIMGENTEHQNIGIPGRHPNHWGVEKDMQEKYGPSIFQTDRTGIQNKVGEINNNAISVDYPSWYGNQFTEHEPQSFFLKDSGPPPRSDKTIESWPDDVEMPGELYWESPSYVGCPTPGSSNAETTLGTQEQVLIIDEDMDINCDTHRTRQTEPVVLERPTGSLEWPIAPSRNPRAGNLHRCQRHRLGGSCGLSILLRMWNRSEALMHINAKELLTILFLLRQYHHSSICMEVWWDDLPETTRNCRINMEPLHSDKHAPSSRIRSVCNESSKCTEPTDRTDGMVYVRPSVLKNNGIIWTTQCRPVCIKDKHEANKLLQLVSGQQSRKSELSDIQLVGVDQPLLLSPVEPDIPGSPESAPRASDDDFNHTSMENSNLVSGSTGIISCSATASTGNDGHTRPQKRKISAVEQQELVPHGMENQRRVLQAQGLSDTAINIIVSNKRAVKRRSRYYSTQKQFLEWHMPNNQSTAIQSSHIVNYLAHIFKTEKLSTNMANPKTVGNSPCIKEFLRAIDETKIKSFVSPEIDISPIVLKINEWGDTSGLDNQKLTTKCCWLLSLCGFLRASDIHRIDDARTIITENTLKLVIIAPKEKRKGQPIERLCEINRHPNHILCPVLAYTVYKARIATELCPTPNANNDSIIVNRLFRHTKHYNKPLSVDSITRHVKNLSGLIKRPPNTPIPKTRAIGATLAATSGVPVENIVSHAFWSNYSMFDTYYRLDRSTQSNMTEAVLPLV